MRASPPPPPPAVARPVRRPGLARFSRVAIASQSLRFRITLLFVAIFGSTLIVFSALLYTAFIRNHQAEFDADLYNHALDVSRAINIDMFGNVAVDSDLLSSGGKIFPFSAGRAFLQILTVEGKLVARSRTLGSATLPFDSSDLTAVQQEGLFFRTISRKKMFAEGHGPEREFRLLTYEVRDRGPVPFILQIAVSLQLLEQERHGLLLFFLIAIPLTLVIAGFGGWYLSASALAPVTAIIESARRLNPKNLSERLPVPPVEDELRQLSDTLNRLLDRLEQAFVAQERFIADASHELKTPLAVLRGELDVLRARAGEPEEVRKFIDSAAQEVLNLSRMVEDLLLLARVDAGAGSLSIQAVRLDELMLETVARLERPARAKGVKIRVDLFGESFETSGDPILLQSLFKNLIENAIKFSPAGLPVEVTVREETGELAVTVRDYGPGIPADLLPRIFERFYRGNQSSQAPGFGLGLAIARRVADAHSATLSVESSTSEASGPGMSGTTFVFRIKKF